MPESSIEIVSPFKAIVFDFGGVVIPGVVLKWVSNLPKTDSKYIFFQEVSHKWDLGEFSVDEFYEALSKITDQNVAVLKETFYDSAEFYPEVIELIKKLKKHYSIILFTNNFSHNVEKYFEKLQITDLFDEVIISSEHKVKKPNPDFFQILLDKINLKSSEVIFIDDSQENVDAGNSLGIKSLLFTNAQKLKQDLLKEGITL